MAISLLREYFMSPSNYERGHDGSPRQALSAVYNFSSYRSVVRGRSSSFGVMYEGIQGAVVAFKEGHPENLQAILGDPRPHHAAWCEQPKAWALLNALQQGLAPADIPRALEKNTPEARQHILDKALQNVGQRPDFYVAGAAESLKQAGARPEAPVRMSCAPRHKR